MGWKRKSFYGRPATSSLGGVLVKRIVMKLSVRPYGRVCWPLVAHQVYYKGKTSEKL
jgi:hypothetical protein